MPSPRRDQPPFAASAMDGYAVQAAEVEPGAMFKVIGEAAAGRALRRAESAPGQAVRIFTGAPVPEGADFVVIQEDVNRAGDVITIALGPGRETATSAPPAADFRIGDAMTAPRRLRPERRRAAGGDEPAAEVPVTRRPEVALIATGDELVMPGEDPGPDQIIASNSFGLKALLEALGREARLLPIARDTEASLAHRLRAGRGRRSDRHHRRRLGRRSRPGRPGGRRTSGMDRAFYKVAMRPGKPLMAGRLGGAAMVGLPGNPVSAMVCGHVFLAPMLRAMLGLGSRSAAALQDARLGRRRSTPTARASTTCARWSRTAACAPSTTRTARC